MRTLGIDPGKNGFLCLLVDCGTAAEAAQGTMRFWPTPTIKVGKGTSNKQDYDVAAMRRILTDAAPTLVILEKQQAMCRADNERTQGTASSFSTGFGYGLWLGLIAGLGFCCQVVHPRTWQAKLLRDVQGTDTKARSITAAGRLFPTVDLRASDRCRKPHDGKADALLIAHYGRTYVAQEYAPIIELFADEK